MNWAGFGRARTEQAYLAEPAPLSPHSNFQRAPGPEVRASPKVLGMRSCTVKLDEENPMYVSLAQENGFGSAELCTMPWLVKCIAMLCTCRKECNKYDLTVAQCFSSAHRND